MSKNIDPSPGTAKTQMQEFGLSGMQFEGGPRPIFIYFIWEL